MASGIEVGQVAERRPLSKMQSVAPAWHTLALVLLILLPLIQAVVTERTKHGQSSNPPSTVQLYILGAVVQIIFFAFAWWGIRLGNNSVQSLIGSRWTSWWHLGRDLISALLFWSVWYLLLSALKLALSRAGIQNSGTSGMVFPNRALELALWIPNAALAGFVEEFVFRGYLMKQFTAWTRSTAAGVVLQATLFGIAHAYLLGRRQVIVITASGLLVGMFVLWRGNLRAAMIFHGWADVFGAVIVRGLPFQ
jgi:membrane protease YdiL (CAAX protease family)